MDASLVGVSCGTYRYGVRGAPVDVQGGGVVVGDGGSGQRRWRGEANRVAAVGETCITNTGGGSRVEAQL